MPKTPIERQDNEVQKFNIQDIDVPNLSKNAIASPLRKKNIPQTSSQSKHGFTARHASVSKK